MKPCKHGHADGVRHIPCYECKSEFLEQERDALRTVLQRYMGAYPAFRMKPVGAEGSPARIEQENLMALEDAAIRALAQKGGSE